MILAPLTPWPVEGFWYMSVFASCTTQIMTIDKDAGFLTGTIDVVFSLIMILMRGSERGLRRPDGLASRGGMRR